MAAETTEAAELEAAYISLFRSLLELASADILSACAETLLWREHALSDYMSKQPDLSDSVRQAAELDIARLTALLRRDWRGDVQKRLNKFLAPLTDLSEPRADTKVTDLKEALTGSSPEQILDLLLKIYSQQGAGILARYSAFRFEAGTWTGIEQPASYDLNKLVDLDMQLEKLSRNTERFLDGLAAQHTLLYGPRGTGKSTAVRGLLTRYAARGLRLVELPSSELTALPELSKKLAARAHHYLIFVDDLSFEPGDSAYHPLKTVLEGSLWAPPKNVLIYATSNRRHLITETFSDRPDPLNEDVHAWDTQNERLALSDRFGLTVTFPNASQRRYLRIVEGLLNNEQHSAENWRALAIRYADWGNGYSGRTARQFVDSL